MNTSDQISNLIDDTLLPESEILVTQHLIDFLESIGIEEGIHYCVDDDDICPRSTIKLQESMDFDLSKKLPNIDFLVTNGSVLATNKLDHSFIKLDPAIYKFIVSCLST